MYLDTTKFSYQILLRLNPNFVKIEWHLHGQKNRSIFTQWRGGGGSWLPHPPAPSFLSNFRDKMVAPIGKMFSRTDAPRMCLQPKKFGLE